MKQHSDINPQTTAAFTGHRWYDFSQREQLKARLKNAISNAHCQGITNFLTGMAVGFDLLAAEAVLEMRRIHPDINLTAIIPCLGQSKNISPNNKLRYKSVLARATDTIILSHDYFPRCFLERNRFMVEHSSLLIASYDGRLGGGTAWTVRLAQEQDKPIINIIEPNPD